MTPAGDYDDAFDVLDVWLHQNPPCAVWEREEYVMPSFADTEGADPIRSDPAGRAIEYAAF